MKFFLRLSLFLITLSSCTAINHSVREANILVELNKDDFELSEQVVGRAERTQIFGIDFKRLFKKQGGYTISTSISSDISSEQRAVFNSFYNLPVIGQVVGDRTASYALYNLFNENPG